jgi:hypothetical protein
MASSRWSLAVVLLATAALPATAAAALTKVADPIAVAPDAPVRLSQYYPDVAMAADGSFAVSYTESDDRAGSDSERVEVQRFTSSLAKTGTPIGVGPGLARETFPAIAGAPDGRFAIAYEAWSAPGRHIEVQRFTAAGAKAGGPIVVDAAGVLDNSAEPPAIAMAADGRFAVAWIATGSELRLRTFGADGAPLTGVVDLASGIGHHPSIGMAPDGRFAVTAVQPSLLNPDFSFTNEDVPVWRFHADGTADGGRGALFTGPPGVNYAAPTLGMSDDGALFAAWADRHDASPGGFEPDIWARRFDGSGAALGDRFIANDYTTYPQGNPDVEPAGTATLLAYEGQVGTQESTYVRQFGPDGTPVGDGDPLSGAPSGTQMLPHVDSDGAGRMVFVWTSGGSGGANSSDVFVGRWNYAAVTDPPPAPGGGDGDGGGGTPPATTPSTPATPAAPVRGSGTTPARPAVPAPRALSAAAVLAQSVTFPPTRSCASRRNFGIRLRVPKGSTVVQATVKVNGRTVAVRKGRRLRSTVDLRRLPKGRFTVAITLKLTDGRTVRGERRYKTCAAKARGGRPKV